MSKKTITHVYSGVVLYSLMQYIFLMDIDTIENHTYFFFSHAIDKNVAKKFKHYTQFKDTTKMNPLYRVLYKLKIRFTQYHKYPFLRNANLYAQDHMFGMLLRNRNYSLLEDGPNFLSNSMGKSGYILKLQKERQHKLSSKIEEWLYGPVTIKFFGNNKYCSDIYLTEENTSTVLEGKRVHVKSLEDMWQESTDEKKDYILNKFNVFTEDIIVLSKRSIAFMTQPLVDDGILTNDEYKSLLQKVFSKYNTHKMVIKTHPRDKFAYKKYFPEIEVFDNPIGMQLLALAGVHFERFVTLFSSSVSGLPYKAEIDYFGTQVHPKLFNYYGDIEPKFPCNLLIS